MSVSYHNSFLQPDLSYIKIFEMKLIHRKYIMTFILYILLKRDQHNGRKLVNPKEEIEDAQFCEIVTHKKWPCRVLNTRKYIDLPNARIELEK